MNRGRGEGGRNPHQLPSRGKCRCKFPHLLLSRGKCRCKFPDLLLSRDNCQCKFPHQPLSRDKCRCKFPDLLLSRGKCQCKFPHLLLPDRNCQGTREVLGVSLGSGRALKQFDWGSIDSESRHSATLHPCKSNSVILGFKKLNHRWTVWTQMQGVKTGQNRPGHGPIHPGCGYADVARVFQRMGRPKSLKIDENAGNFSPVTQRISLHLWSSP